MIVRKASKPCPVRIGALIQRLFAHVREVDEAAEKDAGELRGKGVGEGELGQHQAAFAGEAAQR